MVYNEMTCICSIDLTYQVISGYAYKVRSKSCKTAPIKSKHRIWNVAAIPFEVVTLCCNKPLPALNAFFQRTVSRHVVMMEHLNTCAPQFRSFALPTWSNCQRQVDTVTFWGVWERTFGANGRKRFQHIVLPHHPFTPDSVLCHFFLLPRMKCKRTGRHFHTEEIQHESQMVLDKEQDFQAALQAWQECWPKLTTSEGMATKCFSLFIG